MILPREESATPFTQEPVGVGSTQKPTSEPLDLLLHQVKTDLRSLVESLERTAFVEFQRMQLKAVDGFFRGGLYVCALFAGIALSICTILLLISGIRGAFAAWTENQWAADFATASILLVVVLGGAFAGRSMLHSKILRKTERRLGKDQRPSASPIPSNTNG